MTKICRCAAAGAVAAGASGVRSPRGRGARKQPERNAGSSSCSAGLAKPREPSTTRSGWRFADKRLGGCRTRQSRAERVHAVSASARTFPESRHDVLRPRRARRATRPSSGRRSGGEWRSISWPEAAEQVAALAAALKGLGLEPGDRVMLVSREPAGMADLRSRDHGRGLRDRADLHTNTERDHQHILDDSGARAVIVSTQKLAKTLLPAAIRARMSASM